MELLKELLKTAIPTGIWAIMLYALARHLVARFQAPLGQIAQRLKRLGPAEFEAPPAQATEPARELSTASPPAELAMEDQSLFGGFRAAIHDWLQALPEPQRERALVDALANWQIGWWFEVVNSLIFGSQIVLTQSLNSQPLSVSRVRELYDTAAAEFPDFYCDYPFERWLGWLQDTAQLVATAENETLVITEFGREFLKYLVHRGYSFQRPR